jgi:hypothetical protein
MRFACSLVVFDVSKLYLDFWGFDLKSILVGAVPAIASDGNRA